MQNPYHIGLRAPHLEQTSRSRQSGNVISAPYRPLRLLGGIGLDLGYVMVRVWSVKNGEPSSGITCVCQTKTS
jgi:hypothetical protein